MMSQRLAIGRLAIAIRCDRRLLFDRREGGLGGLALGDALAAAAAGAEGTVADGDFDGEDLIVVRALRADDAVARREREEHLGDVLETRLGVLRPLRLERLDLIGEEATQPCLGATESAIKEGGADHGLQGARLVERARAA